MNITRTVKAHGTCDTCGHPIEKNTLMVTSLTVDENAPRPDRYGRTFGGAPHWKGMKHGKRHLGCPHPDYARDRDGRLPLGPYVRFETVPENLLNRMAEDHPLAYKRELHIIEQRSMAS